MSRRRGPCLALDTSGSLAGVALAGGCGAVLGEQYLGPGRYHGEDLSGLTEGLLASCGVKIGELSGIGVVNGPGSYTGLRVGLALARGLAFVDSLPVVAFSSLELIAAAACGDSKCVCALLDASRGKLFAAGFAPGTSHSTPPLFGPLVVEAGELAELLMAQGEDWTLAADEALAGALAQALGARWAVQAVTSRRMGILAGLAQAGLAAGRGGPAGAVHALYVGPSGARPNRRGVAAAPGRG